jgi:glycerophosphoryl diester phosphodiesterase
MVLISAHKGGAEGAAQVTYEAYQHALGTGVEYAEMDIRKTADNILVVHHDAHAAQTGEIISGLSYDGLCDTLGYLVPKVADVMSMLAGKLLGHLDLKETGYEEEVIELALATFGPGNFVATTLQDVSVRRIKAAFPDVPAALSLGRNLSALPRSRWAAVRRSELFPLGRIRACGADWVSVHHRLARLGVIRDCHRQGIGIMVWTVDTDRLIGQFLADRRVGVLITNRPGYAARRRAGQAA